MSSNSHQRSLSLWTIYVRRKYKKGLLTPDEHAYLQRIRFDFEIDQGFRRWYNRYKEFKEVWNNRPPNQSKKIYEEEMPLTLRIWLSQNRQELNASVLRQHRKVLLDELQIEWQPFISGWEDNFQQLVNFKQQFGHLNISNNHHQLRLWLEVQQRRASDGRIAADRRKRLEGIGVVLNPMVLGRAETIRIVSEFKMQHGHANLPSELPDANHTKLIQKLRRKYRRKVEDKLLREAMDKLGFLWIIPGEEEEILKQRLLNKENAMVKRFDNKLLELNNFIDAHGKFPEPSSNRSEFSLWSWLQRTKRTICNPALNTHEPYVRLFKQRLLDIGVSFENVKFR